MQENPRQVFASWVESLEKAYKDNVEVLDLTSPFAQRSLLAMVCMLPVTSFTCVLKGTLALQEYERRFLVWLDNMEYAHAHNEKQSSFKVHR